MISLPVDTGTAIWFSKFKNCNTKDHNKIMSIKNKSKNYCSQSNHLRDKTMITAKKSLFMSKNLRIKIQNFYKLLEKILNKNKF
jgi:hypothetical protein